MTKKNVLRYYGNCYSKSKIIHHFFFILKVNIVENTKNKSSFFSGSFFNCIISIILWVIVVTMIFISTHTELFLCRGLEGEKNYKTLETIIESKNLLGKPLEISLKDFIE